MSIHTSRGFAAEKVFVDAWKAGGFTFTRNQRSDRMKKFNAGARDNPDLVENLEVFMSWAVARASQNGHSEALEAPLGFKLTGSDNTPDLQLRLHLNNKWVKHPRPSPDSPPGLWFGSPSKAAWNQNTKELWGGVEGGLLRKHRRDGHKTWASLRDADKGATDHLITLMRDALFEECVGLSATRVTAFINYLGLGENTLHICLLEDAGGIESETFGPAPTAGTPVVGTKVSHDRISLRCGEWEFTFRVHSASSAPQPSSFKVEVEVPVHP